jgi:hypothetical protein
MARRHLRDCAGCQEFRGHLRGTSRQFAALLPALGPAGVLAKLLGFGGGSGAAAGGGAAVGGGAVAATAGTGGTIASVGALATGTGHVAAMLAAAVVTAGGAVEIQHTIAPAPHHVRHHFVAAATATSPGATAPRQTYPASALAEDSPARVPAVPPAPPPPARAAVRAAPGSDAQASSDAQAGGSLGGFAGMQPASAGAQTHRSNAGERRKTASTTLAGATDPSASVPSGTTTRDGSVPTSSPGNGNGGAGQGVTGATGSTLGQGTVTSNTYPNGATSGSTSGPGGSTPVGGTSTS